MFKKFDATEEVSGKALLKSSACRALRASVVQQMPPIEPYLEEVLPKKAHVWQIKCRAYGSFYCDEDKQWLFYQDRDGAVYPSLRLLHRYPFLLPQVQVDRGAIRHVLRGADVMSPGLTSAGGRLPEALPAGQVVAVMAEAKQHALAIGRLVLSSEQVRQENRGVAVKNVQYLNDDLWRIRRWME
ncbi:hypothetical protein CDCA_CDCA12G3545 [Cyanidium caldarium]|uniref:PUA domain-containing protein n=1 Tax=Cyanidium caldarium TaxID=2771 RepID=A0AAV9IZI3_CYACA|nr:hypothetical protein CDCA_CDCA12G3545 [Cyanidium caldarium]